MKKFFSEFKKFALRGNVMDLAVGIIIGGAFQAIVKSLVDDVISPVIGLVANTDLSGFMITIGDVQIKYGSFLTAVINFVIMAFVIFVLVRALNKLSTLGKKPEVKVETTKVCPYCKSTIDITATRCPHCTSVLEVEQEKE